MYKWLLNAKKIKVTVTVHLLRENAWGEGMAALVQYRRNVYY
jgi:hypothetical protein